MNNRRNFYRILHVQPEAPLEIIKASYRSLMIKLKAHPDLGGDHETAVLINQAYAVLSDAKRRGQYDEMLHLRKIKRHHPAREKPNDTDKSTNYRKPGNYRPDCHNDPSESVAVQNHCVFCGAYLCLAPKANKYCIHCASPLTPAKKIPNERLREIFGRRAIPRIAKAGMLIIYPNWPHAGFSAGLLDLSQFGISVLTEYEVRAGQVLKFHSVNLKGVARVVSVRANGAYFELHASFLTVEFAAKAGFFVAGKP